MQSPFKSSMNLIVVVSLTSSPVACHHNEVEPPAPEPWQCDRVPSSTPAWTQGLSPLIPTWQLDRGAPPFQWPFDSDYYLTDQHVERLPISPYFNSGWVDVATGTVTEWQGEPVIAGVDGSTPSITAGILEDLAVQLELPQVADQWAQIVGRDLLDGHILWSVDAEAPSTNYGYMFGSCEGLVFAGAGAFRVEDGALAWRWPGERRAVNGMTMKEQGRVIAEFESVADTTVRTVASFNCADGSGAVEFANTWDFWNHALFVPGDEPLVIARADQDGETNNRLVAHSAASGELRFDVPLVDFMSGSFSFGGFTSEGVLYVQDSVLGAFDLSTKTWLWTTDWVERPQNCENHGHHPIYNRGVVFTNSTPIIALDSESGNILGFTVTSDGSPAGDYPMLHGDELIVSGGGNLLSYDVSSLR